MIVDFTVKNFRSIKSEQLLSMCAEKKHSHHAGNLSFIEESFGILKTAAIYGSNAAGKSNLIMAFGALREMVISSGDWKDGDEIECYQPYLLSPDTYNAPTELDVEFYIKNKRYRYFVAFDKYKIVSERLDLFNTARPTNLFTRRSPDNWKDVKFGEHYKGGKRQVAFFSNNAYLSRAGNSPDTPEVIRDVYNYFRRNTETLLTNQDIRLLDWHKKEKVSIAVNTFLNKADFGIEKFAMEAKEKPDSIPFPEGIPDEVKNAILSDMSLKECFYHLSENGEMIKFSSDMESTGTRKLFKMLPVFIEVLNDGSVIFIDEIESSLHPHLAELLIKLFNDPNVNSNNAQLIYTTHDLTLMSQSLLRRDQVYLTEKTLDNGTEITCLDSYDASLKDSSPFAKWYHEGRLGGIPKINYYEISSVIRKVLSDA